MHSSQAVHSGVSIQQGSKSPAAGVSPPLTFVAPATGATAMSPPVTPRLAVILAISSARTRSATPSLSPATRSSPATFFNCRQKCSRSSVERASSSVTSKRDSRFLVSTAQM